MSATARAAGDPSGDRPGRRTPPPLQKGPRTGPPVHVTGSTPRRPAAERPATGERPVAEPRTARTATPAPARPAGTHTAPVRSGSLRSRTAARPTQAPGPAPRSTTGSSASRLRSAVGAHRAPFVLLVVTLLVATTLGLLFLNTAIAVNSLKATQLAAANEDRAQEVQRLEQQVIAGGTPAELAREAREAGMVPAGPAAYLVVGEDGSVTLRGEAVPAEDPEPSEVPRLPAPPVAGGGD
ncbi:hypothetical protein SAMN05660642_02828 [Geodermatophilus siccatus]|uniref:Cell division protein FtsL n=1 Tax=Geodermatophilus siccatus TaxID=1137991 RepID=A0A1G9UJM0_9ACTN|nr:hypothetical protein [Geodermatophilus siccatus]SDM60096.1 hypothetical protein SAMN05660642_02828 [Geodermatophilus siccatus]